MDWLAMITQLAGSEAGRAASQMDRDAAMRLIQSAVDEMGKINVPKLQKLLLQKQGDTGLAGIQDDPTYRSQQNAADAQLGDVIDSGGLTLADKAALNAIRNKSARAESAGRNAITNQMAARGTLDSGSQLAMQLDENSRSANEMSAADEATAGRAEARAFEAIRERARNAGAGLDRSYAQKANAARAQDAINAGNTAIANTAAIHDAGQAQRDFENQVHLAQAKAQPGYVLSDAHKGAAADIQDTWTGRGNVAAAALKSGKSSNALGYDDRAASNAPAWQDPSVSEWKPYPGESSGALSGESTKDDSPIQGYDENGRPIYRRSNPQQLGQNF